MNGAGLTIYPVFQSKALRCVGSVAVGERAVLRVSGVAPSAGLRVRFRSGGKDVARFPASAGEAWTAEGVFAVCGINLNTLAMRKVFKGLCDITSMTFVLVVENTEDKTVYAEAHVPVRNWPANEGEDVPYNLDTWPDEVAALDQRMTELLDALDAHKADADAHSALFAQKVSVGDFNEHKGSPNAHGVTLQYLGAASAGDLNTHTADNRAHSGLFDAKADADEFESHIEGQELSHPQLDALVRQTAEKLGAHDHSGGEKGVRVRHSHLIGTGRHTHGQIDKRLDAFSDALNTLSGEVRGLLSPGSAAHILMTEIKEVFRAASAMPDGSDKERKAQFGALAQGVVNAIERTGA